MKDSHKPDADSLREELAHFQAEKEKIRQIVGQIGGQQNSRRDRVLTILFIVLMVALFTLDVVRELTNLEMPLPHLFSIEIGILLVSIKIIWMIHSHDKVSHFQFWILNSIEFRLTDLSKRIRSIEKSVASDADDGNGDADD